MGQVPGIISEILAEVSRCELCGNLSDVENTCNVYTIEKFDAGSLADLSKSIIVLCPVCMNNYENGIVHRKHLKACVMLRDPGLSEWLSRLFDRYNLSGGDSSADKGLFGRFLDKMAGDQAYINNAIILFGIFIIAVGLLLFCFGYSNASSYDNSPAVNMASSAVQESPAEWGNLLFELGGVFIVLIGLFFELTMVKDLADTGH
jgi:hypothetical protein